MYSAVEIIDQQQKLNTERRNWDDLYQQVADRVWPQMADFNSKRSPGQNRSQKMFDSTAALALERGSAAFHSLITPDSQMWHGLSIGKDPELMEYQPVRAWLEDVRRILFAVRRSPKANFSSQAQECIRTLLAFGTLCMLTEEIPGRGIRYKSMHLSEIDFSENQDGIVDNVYRKFEYTARQAVGAFGESALPSKILDHAKKGDETSKFEFIHNVRPNMERNPKRKDFAGMRYCSCYVSVEGKQKVDEGGYRRFPYHVSRYATNPREIRGRGPAIVLLPDIKLLNEQEKTALRAGHLAVDPPLLIFEDGSLQGFQMRPRALNYGGVDSQGRQLVQPLKTGANLPWAFDMLEARRKLINEGFWLTLFQILVDSPQMTATEAMLRAQEKGQLLAPPMSRQQSEWLGPMVRREIDILSEMDLIPQPPRELLDYLPVDYDPESGVGSIDLSEALDIEYTSPLSKMLRSEESVSVLRTFEQLSPFAQIDPSVFDVFDTDTMPRELANINGVPAKMMRSKEKVEELRAAKAQAAEMQNLLAAAPLAAGAAKDLAAAGQMSSDAGLVGV